MMKNTEMSDVIKVKLVESSCYGGAGIEISEFQKLDVSTQHIVGNFIIEFFTEYLVNLEKQQPKNFKFGEAEITATHQSM